MSILVDLSELAEAVPRHPTAYLLIAGEDRPHVGEVEVEVRDDVLVLPRPGRTARRVLPGSPLVTLLLPPYEPEGYSLVVDGSAELVDDQVRITPSHAVLHRRPRPDSPSSATGCEGDCQPLS
ncbi:pyridoxamine 5'-phosphate oxidase family protein [Ornithinimicrobium sufpigmenti]|uniref:pyridoxamine 5'-phosphate oxidase family protein n=1 Tax=Ornithinimicrobium sufpigmenti TaxID=2508882 RepID=UPI0010365AE1|nr:MULTISPECIES: pyridoxamine 5'-phosphate oxidase family protein [unclassified Ornithinimicrobium]